MNQQQATVDKILIGASALVLIASIYLQFDSTFFDNGEGRSSSPPIGKITQSVNDVRRKSNAGLYWKNTKLSDQVYEGDSVFTGSGSETQIELSNGDKLKLDEQTLVIIHQGASGLELDLAYGGVSGKLAEGANLTIHENGKSEVFKSHDSEVRVTKSREHKAQVRVLSGKVEVQSKESQPKVLAKNEEVELALKGPIEVKHTQQIRLIEPTDNQTLWGHSGTVQEMHWEADGPNLSYQFEIAADNLFAKDLKIQKLSKDTLQHTITNPGTYYWRVKVFENNSVEPIVTSPINKFIVYSDAVPEITFPKADNLFILDRAKEETKRIGFSWKVSSPEDQFQVQISDKADFSQIVLDDKSPDKRFVTSSVDKAGEYYFRVKGAHTSWSESLHFFADFRNTSAVPPVASSFTYVLPFKKSERTATNTKLYGKGVNVDDFKSMTWDPNVATKAYQLDVSRTADFSKSESQKVNGETSFKMSTLKPGPIYWRVKPIYKDDKPSTTSNADHWTVQLPPPQLQPAKLRDEPADARFDKRHPRDAQLTWSPLLFAAGYELQISDDGLFKNFKNSFPKDATKKFSGEKGLRYFWRVRAVGAQGEPLSEFSTASEFSIPKAEERKISSVAPVAPTATPIPFGPKLLEPANETSVITLGNPDAFLSLKWMKGKTVKNYEIEIAAEPTFRSKVIETSSKLNNFVVKQSSLAKGTYYWHVRTQTDTGSTAWSDAYSFSLK